MSCKVILVIALVVSAVCAQQLTSNGPRCLCMRVRDKLMSPPKLIKSMEIYPPSSSCEKVEIVVKLKSGAQYCLDPNVKKIRDIVMNLQKSQSQSQTKQ
ncbi:C-X-C motif chemokine 9-like [Polypterus senegalus]|uniref:C-X-C motif chemokine 9-like n=2 Tax=Polypteridae TaxID=8289 RepID=UPI0019656A95|nr:C-X-C motif chemokine 9-like [Polypterus senegalus]